MPLIIAGDGRECASLEALATALELNDRVTFVGNVLGAAKTHLLQHARCLAVPSRQWEAFGLVVLESYASGCPVIATKLPGLSDLIEPGKTGWLVPPDSPAELATALETAFHERRDARAFRGATLDFVRWHQWANIARRHLDLYAELRRGQFSRAA